MKIETSTISCDAEAEEEEEEEKAEEEEDMPCLFAQSQLSKFAYLFFLLCDISKVHFIFAQQLDKKTRNGTISRQILIYLLCLTVLQTFCCSMKPSTLKPHIYLERRSGEKNRRRSLQMETDPRCLQGTLFTTEPQIC